MAAGTPDTVDQWAPVFTKNLTDDQILNPDYALARWAEGTWCKLCDSATADQPAAHMKGHAKELKAWRGGRKKENEKAFAKRNRERRAELKRQKELGVS